MKIKRRVGEEFKDVILYVQRTALSIYCVLHFGYMAADDSFFFSLISLRKEPCVYCAQVCTSERSLTLWSSEHCT